MKISNVLIQTIKIEMKIRKSIEECYICQDLIKEQEECYRKIQGFQKIIYKHIENDHEDLK